MNCTVHHTRLVPEGARLERQVHLRHNWAQNKSACRLHKNHLNTIRQRHPAGVVVQAMSAGACARQSSMHDVHCSKMTGFLTHVLNY